MNDRAREDGAEEPTVGERRRQVVDTEPIAHSAAAGSLAPRSSALAADAGQRSVLAGGLGLAITADSAGYAIDLDVPGKVTSLLPAGSKGFNLAYDVGIAVFQTAGDHGELVEVVWRVALPQNAAETRRWLDELTNASADLGPTTLTWQ